MTLNLETLQGNLFGFDHPYNLLPMEVEDIPKHVVRVAKLKSEDFKKLFADNLLSILHHDR